MQQIFYKPTDIIIKQLGYKRCSDASWYRNMKKNKNPQHWNGNLFTELGKQYCLNLQKRNKVTDYSNSGIYIIRYPWQIKKIKIGWSNNIYKRIKQYNTILCGYQTLLLHIKTKNKFTEKRVFNIAIKQGLIRNKNYELRKFIKRCKTIRY